MSDKPFKDDRIFIEPPNHVSLISREHLESLQSELSDLRSRLERSEAAFNDAQKLLRMAESDLRIKQDQIESACYNRRQCERCLAEAQDLCSDQLKLIVKHETELVAARAVVEAVRPLNIYIVNTLVAAFDAIVNPQPKENK